MVFEGINLGLSTTLLIIPIIIWELVWKGLALWHSAKSESKTWFIIILIFNTLGILPIIYLLIHRKKDINKNNLKKVRKRKNA